jgi:hypothetical protein
MTSLALSNHFLSDQDSLAICVLTFQSFEVYKKKTLKQNHPNVV